MKAERGKEQTAPSFSVNSIHPSSFILRSSSLWLLWLAVVAGAFAGVGCSIETRYRVLTFFFEGVPPPGQKAHEAAGMSAVETRLAEPVSFHRAFREDRCSECHVGKKRPLKETVPDLCWRCHPRPEPSHPWNHAPERIGDCLACHLGHETMTPYLLLRQGKDLCYKCHRNTYVEDLPAHKDTVLDICVSCHPYHEGGTRPSPEKAEKTLHARGADGV